MRFLKNPDTGKLDLFWLLTLVGLTIYSAFSYLFELAAGQRSEFYASIAVSMSKSLSNWWFGASDPGGTITLDKIPGSYWVPAIFVKVFGFSTWAVNAPNALATIAMVIVVAFTGRELAGKYGGLIAGAVAATTPILAAVARSNQPESFFLLAISLAAFFSVKAVKTGKFLHLMLAGFFIADAFQSYMLVAWAAWPALGIAWLTVKKEWSNKIWQLLVAGFTSLVLSLLWVLSVTFTPASNRPYIGGSNTNSAWEMVFGYNGLGRFSDLTGKAANSVRGFTPPFSGSPRITRLVDIELLSQIGWLLPDTLVAIAVLLIQRRFKPDTWFVSLFFLMYVVMFSAVAGMHQFYTAELGIGAALVLALAFESSRQVGDRVGPVVIIGTAGLTLLFIAIQYTNYLVWAPIVQLLIVVAAIVLVLVGVKGRAVSVTAVAITLALTFTPAAWSADTYRYPSSMNPVAGPSNVAGVFAGSGLGANGGPGLGGTSRGAIGPGGAGAFGNTKDAPMVKYLKAHRQGAKYLLATFGTQSAASYITYTGEDIVPIGGFDGSDPSPSLATIKKWVKSGQLRFFLLQSHAPLANLGASTGQSNTESIKTWVSNNCLVSDYSGGGLYECAPGSVK